MALRLQRVNLTSLRDEFDFSASQNNEAPTDPISTSSNFNKNQRTLLSSGPQLHCMRTLEFWCNKKVQSEILSPKLETNKQTQKLETCN